MEKKTSYYELVDKLKYVDQATLDRIDEMITRDKAKCDYYDQEFTMLFEDLNRQMDDESIKIALLVIPRITQTLRDLFPVIGNDGRDLTTNPMYALALQNLRLLTDQLCFTAGSYLATVQKRINEAKSNEKQSEDTTDDVPIVEGPWFTPLELYMLPLADKMFLKDLVEGFRTGKHAADYLDANSDNVLDLTLLKDPDHQKFMRNAYNTLMENNSAIGHVSDGYHTFDELYDHRTRLFSVICNSNPEIAFKSTRHHPSENLPMYDGMFIAGIHTPYGDATYHCDLDPYWDIFQVPASMHAPEFDGHTPEEAIQRLTGFGVDKFKATNPNGSKLYRCPLTSYWTSKLNNKEREEHHYVALYISGYTVGYDTPHIYKIPIVHVEDLLNEIFEETATVLGYILLDTNHKCITTVHIDEKVISSGLFVNLGMLDPTNVAYSQIIQNSCQDIQRVLETYIADNTTPDNDALDLSRLSDGNVRIIKTIYDTLLQEDEKSEE